MVVPKRSGVVRICVDLKPLNQSVLREVHLIPKVDKTLAQLLNDVESGSTLQFGGLKCIAERILKCTTYAKDNMLKREPLLITPLLDYAWQIGTDLLKPSEHYLPVMDYFSQYPEISRLISTTSAAMITSLKSISAQCGIPEIVHSDNSPQYASREFSVLVELYGF